MYICVCIDTDTDINTDMCIYRHIDIHIDIYTYKDSYVKLCFSQTIEPILEQYRGLKIYIEI